MTSWIEVGSPQDIAMREKTCLNAYMFWIGADCYAIKPDEARDKFAKKLWWDYSQNWIRTMILSQDTEGLTAMREEYTKQTGKDWKAASLNDVKKTLGFCSDLYEQGKVLINGQPNVRAILSGGSE